MRKQKRGLLYIISVLIFFSIILNNQKIFATNTANLFQKSEEYTDEYKEWLELSDEEKEKVMIPRIYEVKYEENTNQNPIYLAKMLRAGAVQKYSLKDIIPANLIIKNQKQTNSCWAFATLSSLETNLALYNYKNRVNTSKVYDFSERHMEYATSKTFANNVENKKGYNRTVGSGGSYQFSESYLTNGTGAIPESEMPFENNENTIDISQIQNKTVSSQVYDTILFPNYSKADDYEKTNIMNQIKQHIQSYGSVQASIHGNSSSSTFNCYNNETGAKYCNTTVMHQIDHAVSVIGWDDNYSVDNFPEKAKPTSNGAWIVRNSWGEKSEEWKISELKTEIFNTYKQQCIAKGWNTAEEIPNSFIEEIGYTIEDGIAYVKYGDNGIIYISYEDANVSKQMYGIIKATDTVNYDNIYQYDEFYPIGGMTVRNSNVLLCNVFDKKTTGTEYLTQVSLNAPETYTCKVYVNPNGTSKAKKDLQLVTLKAGEKETINAGYHTLEFANPIEIKSNSFAVVIEIQSSKSSTNILLESKIDSVNTWDSVTVENGKCFVALGNDFNNCQWFDLGRMTEQNSSLSNGDSTIKAFITSELLDGSLKNIQIVTPPNKTAYFEGENFDKTGMVVKATYNRKENPTVELNSSDYSITNGTNLKVGQTSIKITYQDKSVEQSITVQKNEVVSLKIKTPPTKTEYKEGQSFDRTGMVIEATYKDGTTKVIDDYTITDEKNLKDGQTEVSIVYGNITIKQEITVTPNPLVEIKVKQVPNKTKYVEGQNFDKTGMIIVGIYQDGEEYEIENYNISNGTGLNKEQTYVTIEYNGKRVNQEITVEEKIITQINVEKMPNKIQYIQNKEELDLTGGKIKVIYNDDSTEEIDLTNEQVKISGFNNEKLGKNTVTIKYQNNTTTFEVEIIEEKIAKNSNFDKSKGIANSIKYYTFSDINAQEYMVMNITVNGIVKNKENDSNEYYYYLSSNSNENGITDWVKITEEQNESDKLEFNIDTRNIKNYGEIVNADTLYLYIKEVAVNGGNQSVLITNGLKLDNNAEVDVYMDNAKIENRNNGGIANTIDNTIAPNILPKAGLTSLVILIVIVIISGFIVYSKYRKLRDIK